MSYNTYFDNNSTFRFTDDYINNEESIDKPEQRKPQKRLSAMEQYKLDLVIAEREYRQQQHIQDRYGGEEIKILVIICLLILFLSLIIFGFSLLFYCTIIIEIYLIINFFDSRPKITRVTVIRTMSPPGFRYRSRF